MCLAVPGVISAINGTDATIDYNGITKTANIMLIENPKIGDRVLVHAGFVIQILDNKEGDELIELVNETIKATKNERN